MILSLYPQPPQLHGLETIHRHNVERWPDSWWSSLRNSCHGGSAFIIQNGFVIEGNSLSVCCSLCCLFIGCFLLWGGSSPCQIQVCQPFILSLQSCGEFIWLFRNHSGSGALLQQHQAGCDRLYKNCVYVYFIVFIFLSHSCAWLSELILKIEVKTAMCREKPDKLHCPRVGILTVKIRSSGKPLGKPLLLDPRCIVLSCAQLFFFSLVWILSASTILTFPVTRLEWLCVGDKASTQPFVSS